MNRARDKYRIWDEEIKEYVSSRVFINHHGEACLIRHGGFYQHKTTKEHCTGLTDKNGKLIYEGDVIQENGINRYIHWHNGGWCYSVRYDSKCHWHLSKEDVENAEIIGNIHDEQFREVTKMVEGEQCD